MKLVYIEWRDAHGVSANWEWLKDLKATSPVTCLVRSVGFVIGEDRHNIVLLPHLIEETKHTRGQGCGDMTIPKGCIVRMRILRVPVHSSRHRRRRCSPYSQGSLRYVLASRRDARSSAVLLRSSPDCGQSQ